MAWERPLRYLAAMARCPNCKASVPWDAAECGACHANFEAPDGWQPRPQGAEEARLLQERASRQRREMPIATPGDGSVGLKLVFSLILLLISFATLGGGVGARSGDRFWPTVTGLICLVMLFLVWIPVVYRLVIGLLGAMLAGWLIFLGLRDSGPEDYLWTAASLVVMGAVCWLAERIPKARQPVWFRIIGAGLIAGAFGVIGATGGGLLVVGLACAAALCTRAWITCTGRPVPSFLGWAADWTAEVPGDAAAPPTKSRHRG
jgi:hypothetical protein